MRVAEHSEHFVHFNVQPLACHLIQDCCQYQA